MLQSPLSAFRMKIKILSWPTEPWTMPTSGSSGVLSSHSLHHRILATPSGLQVSTSLPFAGDFVNAAVVCLLPPHPLHSDNSLIFQVIFKLSLHNPRQKGNYVGVFDRHLPPQLDCVSLSTRTVYLLTAASQSSAWCLVQQVLSKDLLNTWTHLTFRNKCFIFRTEAYAVV